MKKAILATALLGASLSATADVDYQKVYELNGTPKDIIKKVSASFGPKYSKEVNEDQLIIRGGFICENPNWWVPNSKATTDIVVEAKDNRYRISFMDTYIDASTYNGITYPANPIKNMKDNGMDTYQGCVDSLARWADKLHTEIQDETILAGNDW